MKFPAVSSCAAAHTPPVANRSTTVPAPTYAPPDARPIVPLTAVAGFCVWRYEPMALLLSLLLLTVLIFRQPRYAVAGKGIARQALRLAVAFGLIKFGLDMLGGTALIPALTGGSVLAGRMLSATGIGLALFLYCGPRSLCLAITWYLRPFLRDRAWTVGLAAALVVHFLPLVFAVVDQCARQTRLRLGHMNTFRRMTILARAVLRQLAQRSWSQGIAIVARDLDRPSAWVAAGAPAMRSMLLALLGIALCLALTTLPF